MTRWYEKTGKNGELVISSRIRLARNLEKYPFPNRMSSSQREEMTKSIYNAIKDYNLGPEKNLRFIRMDELDDYTSYSMAEKRLISSDFATNREGRALLLSADESISIMICEEDHLRIQVMTPGLSLQQAYDTADKIDTLMSERFRIAFNESLGYLTSCPTNLGTGLRASCMLFLPGLTITDSIGKLSNSISKLGLTIRGGYGEGSESKGSLYQLSNQVTLGITEAEAIDNLARITMQIITQEKETQKALIKENPRIEDNIWRAFGILTNARYLSFDELNQYVSMVRMGVSLGYFNKPDIAGLNGLVLRVSPATIMKESGKEMTPDQRDKLRAEIVRNTLNNILH